MSDPQQFDPRFDPAFQPGYRGSVRMPPSSSASSNETKRGPIPSTDAARAQPEPRSPGQPQTRATDQPVEQPVNRPADEFETYLDSDFEPAGLSGRVNPFLIALLVLGAIFIAVGLWIAWQAHALYISVSTSPAGDYGLVQLLLYTGPLILVLGLGTVVAGIVLLAARWDRRSAARVSALSDRSAFR